MIALLALIMAVSADTSMSGSQQCSQQLPDLDLEVNNGVSIYWGLNDLHQEDPVLISALRDHILIRPAPGPLNLSQPTSKKNLAGQFGQIDIIEELFYNQKNKKKKNKKQTNIKTRQQMFFVEAGASDGETISNTLYLELKRNWTGLLVEPNPNFIERLKSKGRNAWLLPHCLSMEPRSEVVHFYPLHFLGGIINQQEKLLPPGHSKHPPQDTIQVQCFPLYSVLKAIGITHIDYFSLDIEGAEIAVLKTIPWTELQFQVLGVEVAHLGSVFKGSKEDLYTFLQDKGFSFYAEAGHDDIFIRK